MGIANDLKTNAENLDGDLRESIADLKKYTGAVKGTLKDGARDAGDELTHAIGDVREAGRILRDHAEEGLDIAREELEAAHEEVLEAGRRVPWKTILGVAAGVIVAVGVISLVRGRSRD